jgi:DNA modification methylase
MKTNIIINKDCIEGMKELPENSVNLVVTSPPYSDVLYYGETVKTFTSDKYIPWITEVAKEVHRILTPDGSFIFNIGNKTENGTRSLYVMDTVLAFVRNANLFLHDEYFWCKNAMPNGSKKRLHNEVEYIYHFVKTPNNFKCNMDDVREQYSKSHSNMINSQKRLNSNKIVNADGISIQPPKRVRNPLNPLGKIPNNIFNFPTAATDKHKGVTVKHPAPFHRKLPEWYIKWLTDPEDIVLDPFMGSGTTAEASILLNRKYIGFEVNQTYLDLAEYKINHVTNFQVKEADSDLLKF